jgi:small multidrug resistance family-3 protein
MPSAGEDLMQVLVKATALFAVTAAAEIGGCYLVYLWLRVGKSAWLLVPAAASLALFALLLTLHPAAAGRTYAAYGSVYIAAAIAWLWAIEGIRPSAWDVAGVAVALAGMAVIVLQPVR